MVDQCIHGWIARERPRLLGLVFYPSDSSREKVSPWVFWESINLLLAI